MIVAVIIILAFTIELSQTLVKGTALGRQNGTHSRKHNMMVLKELTYQALTWKTGTHYITMYMILNYFLKCTHNNNF